MWKCNDKSINLAVLNSKKALSLVELVIVTFIIAIAASVAFPTYKIFQQRSKERRLKKILTDVRAAINGTKSHNSSNSFEEGFRTVARVKGMERIDYIASQRGWDNPLTVSPKVKQNCIGAFIAKIGEGYGYPKSPNDIWSPNPYADFPDTLIGFYPVASYPESTPLLNELPLGDIPLERRFYRSKPVHPFHDWYPGADFEYVPVFDRTGNASGTTYTIASWTENFGDLRGVKDIVSRGAGLALDGSNTNEW